MPPPPPSVTACPYIYDQACPIDISMDYSRFELPRTQSGFAPTDSHYNVPSSFPTHSSPDFHGIESGSFGSGYLPHHERQGSQGMSMANMEEGDTASRSRLTQEQLAQLEHEFALRYKPNTEYKKSLAERMGVEYHKVNVSNHNCVRINSHVDISQNWFQNRRAKAKHQTSQDVPRFDLSTDEEGGEFPAGNLTSQLEGMSQPQPSTHFSTPEQSHFLSGDFPTSLDFHNLDNVQPQYSIHPGTLTNNINAASAYESNGALPSEFANVVGTESIWPGNDLYAISMPKMPTPTILDQDPFSWSPVSSSDHPGQLNALDFATTDSKSHGHSMYQNTINGDLIGNPSSQTFGTTSSEDGEQTKLITPPQETSPMPEFNQGIFTRRESNSSELAQDFDTIHLQQQQPQGLDLYTTSNSTALPDASSSLGLATPDISPDPAAMKTPTANGHDLASRRKRQRPPTLQPDSGRSVSYAGPATISPHLRISSPGPGKLSPVRRIKSTGNNLNIMTGRVSKPGSISAQMSPRNYESCFQVVKSSEPKPSSGLNTIVTQSSSADVHVLNSSSPATFAPKPHPRWPAYPSQYGAPDPTLDHGSQFPSQLAAGFSLPPSPPNHSNTTPPPLQVEQLSYPQQLSYHCPQSAPPHLTSFFEVSPPMGPGAFTPWGGPTPSITPPEPYRDGTNMPVPLRPNHALHHSQSQHFNYFQASQPTFHGYPPGLGQFQPHHHPFSSAPSPAKKELDIKIEKGPPPPRELSQLSQEHKTYVFSHSTPDDFSPATNSKR